jgi:RNA polymerase sigma factor (sigma-70 family)
MAMKVTNVSPLLRFVRTLSGGPCDRLSDRELLRRFREDRQEEAFAALLRRHGPMVLGVCRRVLGHEQDAEDAFQATFLVLAQKSGTGAWQESIGTWLYEVADRTARDAKKRCSRRDAREVHARHAAQADPLESMSGRELLAVLDAEINSLPAECRAPLALCCLEGRTGEEAAGVLGCSLSTLKRRLARGRELLQARLARRGIALPVTVLATLLVARGVGVAAAPVSPPLLLKTLNASCLFVSGAGTHSVATTNALTLATEGIKTMTATKTKAALVMAALGALLTAGLLLASADRPDPTHPDEPALKSARPAPEKEQDPKDNAGGKPIALEGHKVGVAFATFIDGGKTVITADHAGEVHLTDAVTGKHKRSFKVLGGSCSVAALSPDGRSLAVGGWKKFAIYDLETGRETWTTSWKAAQVGRCWGVAFTLDGKRVIAGSDDPCLRVWEVTSGKKQMEEYLKPEGRGSILVTALALSPDGKTIAYGGTWLDHPAPGDPQKTVNSLTVRLRDLESGREHQLAVDVTGENKAWPDGVSALAFSPDGKRLVASMQVGFKQRDFKEMKGDFPKGLTGTFNSALYAIRIWDVESRRELPNFGEPVESGMWLAFSPDGRTVASTAWNGTVSLWELSSRKVRLTIEVGACNWAKSLMFTPDGRSLLVGGRQPRIWPVKTAPAAGAPADLKDLWADLASEDAVRAFKAVRALIADPQQSVPFLDKQVRAVKLDEARVKQLVTDLGDEQFSVREDAAKELKKLGEIALPYLKKTLANETRPEAAQRLKDILAAGTRGPIRSPEVLRVIRAVEALEYAGTPEAVRVLESLAKDLPDTWAGAEAKPAVERLRARR